uniref:Helicase ATP-binding domain-containing protein n=1 Tax=Timema poppense TaxID=170557 RepID=A0A7R9CKX3_TIMPO|nr:unnamed protein product [Timema poppensis]
MNSGILLYNIDNAQFLGKVMSGLTTDQLRIIEAKRKLALEIKEAKQAAQQNFPKTTPHQENICNQSENKRDSVKNGNHSILSFYGSNNVNTPSKPNIGITSKFLKPTPTALFNKSKQFSQPTLVKQTPFVQKGKNWNSDNCVVAKCHLISKTQFAVDVKYHQQLIDIFKSVKSALYEMGESTATTNLTKGFEATGIFPLDRNSVITKLPFYKQDVSAIREDISEQFKGFIENVRTSDLSKLQKPKKFKLPVQAGKSVSLTEVEEFYKNKSATIPSGGARTRGGSVSQNTFRNPKPEVEVTDDELVKIDPELFSHLMVFQKEGVRNPHKGPDTDSVSVGPWSVLCAPGPLEILLAITVSISVITLTVSTNEIIRDFIQSKNSKENSLQHGACAHAHIYSAVIGSLYKRVHRTLKLGNFYRKTIFPLMCLRFGLSKCGRCLLADDMGLGKTIQALGIMHYYRGDWPLLIVCPSSVRYAWLEAIQTWLPTIPTHHIEVMTSGKDDIGGARILITSYDLMSRYGKQWLAQKSFGAVIMDESHFLKSSKSARTKVAILFFKQAKRVLLLSGTPALSRPSELYTQIAAIDPKAFGSFHDFGLRYCAAVKTNWAWDYSGSSNMVELHLLLEKRFMIRRLKSNVISELPPKIR